MQKDNIKNARCSDGLSNLKDLLSEIHTHYIGLNNPQPQFDEKAITNFDQDVITFTQSLQSTAEPQERGYVVSNILDILNAISANPASTILGQYLTLKFYTQIGDKSNALLQFNNIANANPNSEKVLSNILKIILQAGYHKEAKAFLLRNTDMISDKEFLLAATIQILTAEKKFKSVWEILRQLNIELVGDALLRSIINFHLHSNNHLAAYELLKKLSDQYPNDLALHETLLGLAIENRDLDKAYKIIHRFRNSDSESIRLSDAELTLALGDIELAKEKFKDLVTYDAGNIPALFGWLKSEKAEKNYLVERILKDGPPLNHTDLYYFSGAKYFHDIEDYSTSLQFLRKGNMCKKKALNYNKSSDKMLFDVLNKYSAPLLKKIEQCDVINLKNIFIVGLPRSGTTLLEQLLQQHSYINSFGELEFMNLIMSKTFLLKNPIENQVLHNISEQYARMSARSGFRAETITLDKMPLNFRWSYFILASMPNAKIINLTRDRKPHIWALFKQYFQGDGNGFCYSIDDINHYYDLYTRFTENASKKLPKRFMNVKYEDLINDQNLILSKIYQFLDIPFEECDVNYHVSKAPIFTASATQVRQPIYKYANEQYQIYEKFIDVTRIQND